MRPPSNTAMRSDRVSASAWSWVTYIIVTPSALVEVADLELHLLAQRLVQRAERFVQQHDRRFEDQRAGQRDALLLPAGELRRAAIG